jgi:hypothetical protein
MIFTSRATRSRCFPRQPGQFFDIFTRARSIRGGACGNRLTVAERHNKLRNDVVGFKSMGFFNHRRHTHRPQVAPRCVPCSQITQL